VTPELHSWHAPFSSPCLGHKPKARVAIIEEGIIFKCIYACVLSQWKIIFKITCVLCEFIPLEYEEMKYSLNLYNLLLHFI
jgi:hypothetical protein